MMKQLSFHLIAALALSVSQFAHAQGNAEATNLARRGSDAAKNKNWDKAIEDFRKAAQIDRKFAQFLEAALQQRAAAYVGEQKFPEAVADFSEALKISPRDAGIYERRAAVEMKMNEVDKALADYSEAIKLNPNEVRYYLYRSYILETKGDLKGSMADTEKVLKMDKANEQAQSRKARLQVRLALPPPTPTPGNTPIPAPPRPSPPPKKP
jgi:tetratricopeptide (TPR) repeat protein